MVGGLPRISFDRISEIRSLEQEENLNDNPLLKYSIYGVNQNLNFENVCFRYGGPHSTLVLDEINFTIETGKVTAIVGASGSGKTTLLKLLLKYYPPTEGRILLDSADLTHRSARDWRGKCGIVMQDGYIFSDSIANNICVNDSEINIERLQYAVQVANISDFIGSLPLGFNTKIGADGSGISAGQRQRILIARAVYRDPQYLFFDEATSALDSSNEKVIMDNLQDFFKGKTVVIIAHRLSTVKNADKIVVLENGKVVEEGNHLTLSSTRGKYFELVKNQLELGD